MERREFLFVQSTTEQGGAETVLLNAMRANTELRRRSAVAMLGFGAGDLARRIEAEGVDVIELRRARLRNPVGAFKLARSVAAEARRRGARAVIGNGAHPQVFGGIAARMAGAKSVYYVHMIHDRRLIANHPIDVLALRGPCDLAIANSDASLAAMTTLRPRLRGAVLYPGTPIELVSNAEASSARFELGALPGDVLFSIFGRLQAWKGQDVFLAAAAQVVKGIPNARFAVVGGSVFGIEPQFDRELRAKADALGLSGRIVFTGQRADVARLMAASDVVCHATRVAEPFGMVIIEAMAQGRPVIATRGGGPGEIVVDGETGILVEPNNPGELGAAMLRLGKNSTLRAALGAAACRRAGEHFSADGFSERLLRILVGLE